MIQPGRVDMVLVRHAIPFCACHRRRDHRELLLVEAVDLKSLMNGNPFRSDFIVFIFSIVSIREMALSPKDIKCQLK